MMVFSSGLDAIIEDSDGEECSMVRMVREEVKIIGHNTVAERKSHEIKDRDNGGRGRRS